MKAKASMLEASSFADWSISFMRWMVDKTAAFKQRRAADTLRWREWLHRGAAVYLVEVGGHVPSCVVATDERGRCPSSLPSAAVLHAARRRLSTSCCALVVRVIGRASR